jgi:hypothetical protein
LHGKENIENVKRANRRRAAQKISPPHPTLAIVLGSGFHHVLTGLRVEKSPLRCGRGWIKVVT